MSRRIATRERNNELPSWKWFPPVANKQALHRSWAFPRPHHQLDDEDVEDVIADDDQDVTVDAEGGVDLKEVEDAVDHPEGGDRLHGEGRRQGEEGGHLQGEDDDKRSIISITCFIVILIA